MWLRKLNDYAITLGAHIILSDHQQLITEFWFLQSIPHLSLCEKCMKVNSCILHLTSVSTCRPFISFSRDFVLLAVLTVSISSKSVVLPKMFNQFIISLQSALSPAQMSLNREALIRLCSLHSWENNRCLKADLNPIINTMK